MTGNSPAGALGLVAVVLVLNRLGGRSGFGAWSLVGLVALVGAGMAMSGGAR